MRSVTCLLFDMDGTLVDPQQGVFGSIRHAMQRLGVPMPAGDLNWAIGPPLAHTFSVLLRTQDDGLVRRAIELYRERYSEIGVYENVVYPGMLAALAALKERGYRLMVATSKAEVFAQRIVSHFGMGAYFERVHGAELEGARSEKADLLPFVLEVEHLAPGSCALIGDREHDMLAATAIGVRASGALWGYGSRAELAQAGAEALVELPEALLDLLPGPHAFSAF